MVSDESSAYVESKEVKFINFKQTFIITKIQRPPKGAPGSAGYQAIDCRPNCRQEEEVRTSKIRLEAEGNGPQIQHKVVHNKACKTIQKRSPLL